MTQIIIFFSKMSHARRYLYGKREVFIPELLFTKQRDIICKSSLSKLPLAVIYEESTTTSKNEQQLTKTNFFAVEVAKSKVETSEQTVKSKNAKEEDDEDFISSFEIVEKPLQTKKQSKKSWSLFRYE